MLKYRLVLPELAGSGISLSAKVVAAGGVEGRNAEEDEEMASTSFTLERGNDCFYTLPITYKMNAINVLSEHMHVHMHQCQFDSSTEQ